MFAFRAKNQWSKSCVSRKFCSLNKSLDLHLLSHSLGPFKLANVLNRCLDRFEHPDENIQHTTVPTATFEGGLHSEPPQVQDHSRHPPFVSSPISSLDTAKMPPLLHQPHWHATEKIGSISPASQETQDSLTWSAETSTVPECALPVRALVRSDEDTGAPLNILITDDNAINRRVSLPTTLEFLDLMLKCRSFL